jgi:hypothetical protein
MKNRFADGMAISMACHWISQIDVMGTDVTQEEKSEVDSFRERLGKQVPLTQKQSKALRQIHTRRVKLKSAKDDS